MPDPVLSTSKEKNVGRVLMVMTALLWGLAGVCIKSITWNPMPIVACRNFISLLMMIAVRKSVRVKLTKTNIFGALCMSATGMLYLASIKMTAAGTAIVLQYIAPILVFLYAVCFQKRKAKFSEILITAAVFCGIALSFADTLFADEISVTALIGDLLGLASGITYAAQIIIMSGKESDSQGSMMLANCLSLCIGLPFLLTDSTVSFDVQNLVWILILGIFQYGLANFLFTKGIRKINPVEASLILTIEPIFNPIPVALIAHEMMGPYAIIGAVIVIFFVTLYGLLPTIEAKIKAKKSK